MKKSLLYLLPFIVMPLATDLIEYFDVKSVYIAVGIIILFAVVLGSLSPSSKKNDLVMAILVPASLFCSLLACGFLTTSETYGHEIGRAFRVATQNGWLIVYLIVCVVTWAASFKPIRILSLLKKAK